MGLVLHSTRSCGKTLEDAVWSAQEHLRIYSGPLTSTMTTPPVKSGGYFVATVTIEWSDGTETQTSSGGRQTT